MGIRITSKELAKTLAKKIQVSARNDAFVDLPYQACLNAVARGVGIAGWKEYPNNLELECDPAVAADPLAQIAGIPSRVLEVIIEGTLPRPSDHKLGEATSEIFCSQMGREFQLDNLADRAGALVLSPGVNRLCVLVNGRKISDDTLLPEINVNDPRLPSIVILSLLGVLNALQLDRLLSGGNENSDDQVLQNRLQRAVIDRDARAFDDALWQIPPQLLHDMTDMLLGMCQDTVQTLSADGDLPVAPAYYLPFENEQSEPITCNLLIANYDAQWRRLDSVDMLSIASVSSEYLFGNAWIRLTTDHTDKDLIALGLGNAGPVQRGLHLGDNPTETSSAIWILGLGPSQAHVAPICAMHFVRKPDPQTGEFTVILGEVGTDAGMLAERARATFGRVAIYQVLDDIDAFYNSRGSGVKLCPQATNSVGPPSLIEYKFYAEIIECHARACAKYGNEFMSLIGRDGLPIDPCLSEVDAEPNEINPITIMNCLGRTPWGAFAILREDGWQVRPLPSSSSIDLTKAKDKETAFLDVIRHSSPTLSDTEDAEILRASLAASDLERLASGEPARGHIHRELLKRNARVVVFVETVPGTAMEGGITYAEVESGETIHAALIRTMEAVLNNGSAFSYRIGTTR